MIRVYLGVEPRMWAYDEQMTKVCLEVEPRMWATEDSLYKSGKLTLSERESLGLLLSRKILDETYSHVLVKPTS